MREPFRFKQFSVNDEGCTMKVGTDGVLLGAWVKVEGKRKVLDIGTGSGLIALMIAQRTGPATVIDAVEMSEPDAEQAAVNVGNSPWKDRVFIHRCRIQDFRPATQYDLIVSNPPFFSMSELPPATGRRQARHTVSLSDSDLISSVVGLLGSSGSFAVILPTTEGDRFRERAQSEGLYCRRAMKLFSRQGRPQERWLFELVRLAGVTHEEQMIIHGQGDEWSPDYMALTAEFYLARTVF